MKGGVGKAAAFGWGTLFALGLGVSGLGNPNKVLAFLDLRGDWDPSLLFVMGGAIGVCFLPFQRSALARPSSRIDRPLLLGSLCFGVGWGLSGLCPGPALVSLAFLKIETVVFVSALIVGSVLAGMRRSIRLPLMQKSSNSA